MEQVFIQILIALGLLFGGGVLVKLYEIFRARNASDNEQLVRHYQTLLADERKEHARVVAELWASVRSMREEYDEERGKSTDTDAGMKAVD